MEAAEDMTKIKKKVLSFPRPPEEPVGSIIIFQVGNDRFAIHWEIEQLPPATPLVRLKRLAKKETSVKGREANVLIGE